MYTYNIHLVPEEHVPAFRAARIWSLQDQLRQAGLDSRGNKYDLYLRLVRYGIPLSTMRSGVELDIPQNAGVRDDPWNVTSPTGQDIEEEDLEEDDIEVDDIKEEDTEEEDTEEEDIEEKDIEVEDIKEGSLEEEDTEEDTEEEDIEEEYIEVDDVEVDDIEVEEYGDDEDTEEDIMEVYECLFSTNGSSLDSISVESLDYIPYSSHSSSYGDDDSRSISNSTESKIERETNNLKAEHHPDPEAPEMSLAGDKRGIKRRRTDDDDDDDEYDENLGRRPRPTTTMVFPRRYSVAWYRELPIEEFLEEFENLDSEEIWNLARADRASFLSERLNVFRLEVESRCRRDEPRTGTALLEWAAANGGDLDREPGLERLWDELVEAYFEGAPRGLFGFNSDVALNETDYDTAVVNKMSAEILQVEAYGPDFTTGLLVPIYRGWKFMTQLYLRNGASPTEALEIEIRGIARDESLTELRALAAEARLAPGSGMGTKPYGDRLVPTCRLLGLAPADPRSVSDKTARAARKILGAICDAGYPGLEGLTGDVDTWPDVTTALVGAGEPQDVAGYMNACEVVTAGDGVPVVGEALQIHKAVMALLLLWARRRTYPKGRLQPAPW